MNIWNKFFKKNLAEGKYGTGAKPSPTDKRDRVYDQIASVGEPIDWNKGYDIEKELNFKIPFKNQNGSSSCFHGNTLVLMEDFSYKPIKDINVGEIVFTHLGNRKRVTHVFKKKWQGITKKITLWGDNREIEVTKDHPFYAIKRPGVSENKNNKKYYIIRRELPSFYPIGELNFSKKTSIGSIGDWVALPFNNLELDKTIYNFEKDSDFLWLLGLYLAEGCVSKYGVHFSVHKDEFFWYDKIKLIMKKYDDDIFISYSFKKKDNGLCISIMGKKWSEIFEELGGKMCNKKRINKRLMFLSPSLQYSIYRGLADGDGHNYKIRKGNIIVSTSEELLIQIRTILLRNGIYSYFNKRKKYQENRKECWTLEVNLENNNRYSFIKNNYCFALIKTIKHNRSYAGGHVYNIEVEDDNSYIVNGIAVHNCVFQTISYYGGVLNKVETSSYNEFSAKAGYSQIRLPGGGAWIRDGMALGVKWGFTPENKVSSYENEKPPSEKFMTDLTWKTPEIDNISKVFQSKEYRTILASRNMELFAMSIRDNYGVCSGVNGCNNGTWNTLEPKPGNTTDWMHALYFGKFGIDQDGKYIATPNSWGNRFCGQWQKIREDYFLSGNMFDAYTFLDKPNCSGKIFRLITMAGDDNRTVFWVGSDGIRRAFMTANQYKEMCGSLGFDLSFGGMETLTKEQLMAIPEGQPFVIIK
jgi:hypothetical protein